MAENKAGPSFKTGKPLKVSRTIERGDLSLNEKKVFWAIVRWPQANDRVLGKKVGLKMSTVTAIRNRIKRAGGFFSIRIPYLARVGVELMTVSCYRIHPTAKPEDAFSGISEAIAAERGVFYAFMDRFHVVMFGLYRDYSDAYSAAHGLKEMMAGRGLIFPNIKYNEDIIFPLRHSRFLRFFDYSDIVRRHFGIDDKLGAKDFTVPEPETRPDRHVSNIEKKVYLGLLLNPEMVDNHVGKKIGVTRQSVTKIRKRFEADGLIGYARIPDVRMLGMGLMTFVTYRPSAQKPMDTGGRKKAMAWALQEMPSFFSAASDTAGAFMAVTEGFDELQDLNYMAHGVYAREQLLNEAPKLTIFSTKEIRVIKNFEFEPLIRDILKMREPVEKIKARKK